MPAASARSVGGRLRHRSAAGRRWHSSISWPPHSASVSALSSMGGVTRPRELRQKAPGVSSYTAPAAAAKSSTSPVGSKQRAIASRSQAPARSRDRRCTRPPALRILDRRGACGGRRACLYREDRRQRRLARGFTRLRPPRRCRAAPRGAAGARLPAARPRARHVPAPAPTAWPGPPTPDSRREPPSG